jgi:hypothetical protein
MCCAGIMRCGAPVDGLNLVLVAVFFKLFLGFKFNIPLSKVFINRT